MRTAQEVFNDVCTHLATQKVKSSMRLEGGACLYRGPNGLKCAVGGVIPDEVWEKLGGDSLNSEAIDNGNRAMLEILTASGIPTDRTMMTVLASCQSTHDTLGPGMWKQSLSHCATNHGLTFDEARYDELWGQVGG